MPHKFNGARRDKLPKQKHQVSEAASLKDDLRRAQIEP